MREYCQTYIYVYVCVCVCVFKYNGYRTPPDDVMADLCMHVLSYIRVCVCVRVCACV